MPRKRQSKFVSPPEYLSPAQVAQILAISERKAFQLIHHRRDPIPFHRLGARTIRVKLSELHEWMQRRREDVSKVDAVVDDVMCGLGR
jgi:excisionase family DNA binding protein